MIELALGQVWRQDRRDRRCDAQSHGAGIAVGDAANRSGGRGDVVEDDLCPPKQFDPAPVTATRRVVRVSSGVPTSRSSRRTSSLRVGCAM